MKRLLLLLALLLPLAAFQGVRPVEVKTCGTNTFFSAIADTGGITCTAPSGNNIGSIILLDSGGVNWAAPSDLYYGEADNTSVIGANDITVRIPVGVTGTIKAMYFSVQSNLTAGSATATLRINNSGTTMTCTFSTGSKACNDTTHTQSVSAGDGITIEVSAASGTLPTSAPSLGVLIQ